MHHPAVHDPLVGEFEIVEPVFQTIYWRVNATGAEDMDVLESLTPRDRAIYARRIIEGAIDNGGWFAVFYNSVDHLIEPAIAAYDLLGLVSYADLLRRVRASGFGEDSPDEEGEAFDDEYFALTGSEQARASTLQGPT